MDIGPSFGMGHQTRKYALLALVLVTSLVACTTLFSRPRQGWDSSFGPVVPHDKFPADCSLCHTGKDWHTIKSDFTFDHAAETGVALNGAHEKAKCLMCHNDRGAAGVFAAQGCAGCHEDIHRGKSGRMCADCHTEDAWQPRDMIARHNRTRFPLVGAHASAGCFRCHPGAPVGNFEGADSACANCHQNDLARATFPDHAAQGWTSDCQRCHLPVGWQPAQFQHPASFPLTAGHAGQSCSDCHSGGVFTGLSADCASCHTDTFQQTTSPNHAAAGFSTACATCHTTSTWRNATFTHTSAFPLNGAHAGRSCAACHVGDVFSGLSGECQACHLDDFQHTTNPNHASMGFDTNCTTCHNTSTWQGATFSHPGSFPLTAGHAGRACTSCHTGGVYTGLSTTCVSCHLDDFQGTTDPNHVAGGFSQNCTVCHTTTTWQGGNLAHPSSFPLTAGHSGRACSACHTGGVFTGLTTACASCHTDTFQQTTSPNHAAAGMGTTCNTCHNTTRWQAATYAHTTAFPLTAGHAGRSCNACHSSGVYAGLSSTCASCHLDDFQRTTDPNHVTGGFSTNCTACHTTVTWQGANTTHPATFPLTAGHSGRACSACHTGGVYTGLSTTCASCHTDEYQQTTDPNHVNAHFSTNCTTCHNTATWQGASFTHPGAFPLTAGHSGRACAACHPGGVYTGTPTACASCHLDDYQRTANPNHAAAGMSTTCTTCHNTTTWQGGSFAHPAGFPLTAGHAGRTCIQCHVGEVYAGTSNACASCHLDDYNRTTNPNHGSAGFSTTCTACHNTTRWQGAVFNHRFPITSGPHRVSCNNCHLDQSNQTVFSCTHCHEHRQSSMDNQHNEVPGYVWSSPACYQCHPNGRH